jgi:three-Cys-motif partner protein
MSPRNDHFDEFGDHTRLKHYLLDAYLQAWASVLTKRFPEVWFIDAFAGAGRDRVGNDGSPLIAAKIARDINRGLFRGRLPEKSGGMRIVCYEKDEKTWARLVEAVAEIQRDPHVSLRVRNNTLEDRVGPVVKHLAKHPVLYFLDPFGVDGLSAAVIKQLLKGGHHELLMLFADEAAVRLAGKAHAGLQDPEVLAAAAEEEVRNHGNLFGQEGLQADIAEKRAAAFRSAAGHKSNAQAQTIMDHAYGGNWWQPILRNTPDSECQEKAVELYEQRVLRGQGANYVLRFSVRTKDHNRHKYFLLHASKNSKAHVEMKRAMHATRKQAAEPGSMFEGFEPSIPLPHIIEQVAAYFSGRSNVRWQGTNDPTSSVKDFIEHETPAWLHEVRDLKILLAARFGDRKADGKPTSPFTLTFP